MICYRLKNTTIIDKYSKDEDLFKTIAKFNSASNKLFYFLWYTGATSNQALDIANENQRH